jgi:hypothetical protein
VNSLTVENGKIMWFSNELAFELTRSGAIPDCHALGCYFGIKSGASRTIQHAWKAILIGADASNQFNQFHAITLFGQINERIGTFKASNPTSATPSDVLIHQSSLNLKC